MFRVIIAMHFRPRRMPGPGLARNDIR